MKQLNGKKVLCALSAFTLTAATFAGCGGGSSSITATGNSSTANSTSDKSSSETVKDTKTSGEPMEITFIERAGREWDPNGEVYKMIEEKYNVKINVDYVQEQGGTQSWYSLRIAAGDTPAYVPDVSFSDYTNYVKQGIFAEIPLDSVKQYAPDMVEWYSAEAGENVWNLYDIEGKNYALPILWSLGNHWSALAIRQDWLKEVGIETLPSTLDELETAMEKVKAAKNMDYVISGQAVSSFDFVGGAYDVYLQSFYEGNDGKLYWGDFHPNAKSVLERLNSWYTKGYIDKEFITNKDEMETDRWINGKTMLLKRYWPDFVSDKAWYGGGTMFTGVKAKNPKAEPVQIPAPKGADGSSGFAMSNPVVGAFCMSEELSSETINKYLEIFNGESQIFENLELNMKGIEGTHFKIEEDGTYVTLPPYDTDKDLLVKDGVGMLIPGNFNNYTAQMPFMTAPSATEERVRCEGMNIGKYDMMRSTYRPLWAEKGTQFVDFCKKNSMDFITGARPLDQYDAFVEEAKTKYYGEELVKEAEEVFTKISKKLKRIAH